jgi:NAD/NADP transhydrogenase beta subunit
MALQNKNMDLNPDSEDDHSQSTLNGSGNGNGESDKYLAIAKRETAVVNWFRLALLVVLAASIAGVGYGVFTYINTAEQQEFEEQFHADANKVFESMGNSLDVTIGAVDAFVVSIISFARYTNATWPFVTIPGASKQLHWCFRLIMT